MLRNPKIVPCLFKRITLYLAFRHKERKKKLLAPDRKLIMESNFKGEAFNKTSHLLINIRYGFFTKEKNTVQR